jgi:alpha-tubulin suppressor-like RCC1 family protein
MKQRLFWLTVVSYVLVGAASASAATAVWGYQGIPVTERTTATELPGLPESPTLIQAGYHSAYALEPDGTVYAFGQNIHGQLGDGGRGSLKGWVKVRFPAGVRITALGITLDGGAAVDSTGQGWEWGRGNNDVSCGVEREAKVPKMVPSLTDVSAVSGYQEHILWLTDSGTVLACGENGAGQAGQPAGVGEVATPTEVPGIAGAVQLASGSAQSLVLTGAGKVYGFGNNNHGQLCERKKPNGPLSGDIFGARQLALPGAVSDIATGNGTSLFLVEGVPYGCGVDTEGTIGDGQTSDKTAPTVASELLTHDFTSLITGAEESAGVAGGEIYTWGAGQKGDLGNGQSSGFDLSPFPAYAGVEVSATALDVVARG